MGNCILWVWTTRHSTGEHWNRKSTSVIAKKKEAYIRKKEWMGHNGRISVPRNRKQFPSVNRKQSQDRINERHVRAPQGRAWEGNAEPVFTTRTNSCLTERRLSQYILSNNQKRMNYRRGLLLTDQVIKLRILQFSYPGKGLIPDSVESLNILKGFKSYR